MSYRNWIPRRGLTLLELVVVMVILVALAGILVPMLPGMLGKAHTSSHVTNVNELNKVWELYNAEPKNHGYPNNLDSLINTEGELYKKLGAPSTGSPYFKATLSALATAVGDGVNAENLRERLEEAGITHLYVMDDNAKNATFEPYVTSGDPPTVSPAEITASTTLCGVLPAEVNSKLNGPADGVYVIFGIGSRCTAVGRGGMTTAPVHFSEHGGDAGNPTNVYSRFGVIFNVKADPAMFVGVVALHGDGISGAEAGIREYYEGHRH